MTATNTHVRFVRPDLTTLCPKPCPKPCPHLCPKLLQRTSSPVSDEYAWAQKYAYALNGASAGLQQYAGQTRGTPYVGGYSGSPLGGYLGGTTGPARY